MLVELSNPSLVSTDVATVKVEVGTDAVEKSVSFLTTVEAEKTGVENRSLLRKSSLISMDVATSLTGVGSIVSEPSLEANTSLVSMLLTRAELVMLEKSVNSSLASTNVVKTDLGVGKEVSPILSPVIPIDLPRAELGVDTLVNSTVAPIEVAKTELKDASSLKVKSMEVAKTEIGTMSLVKNSLLISAELSKLEVGVGSRETVSLVWDTASLVETSTSTIFVSENKLEEAKVTSIDTRLPSAVAIGETESNACSVELTSVRVLEDVLDNSEKELISRDLDRTNAWDGSDWTGVLKPPLPSVRAKDDADNEEIVASSTKLSTLENISIVDIKSALEVEELLVGMTGVLSAKGKVVVICSAVVATLELTLTSGVGSTSEVPIMGVDSISTADCNIADEDVIVSGIISLLFMLAIMEVELNNSFSTAVGDDTSEISVSVDWRSMALIASANALE